MGEVWIKEAKRLTPAGTAGTMSGVGGPRATLHCTVSNPGSFNAMHRVLVDKRAEPHLLYDPLTDQLGQYFPLDKSARALKGSPEVSPSHNKAGTVNIQVEVCAQPNDWTVNWKPGPNFRAMMRAIASWGIKPEFVFRLPKSGSDRVNVARPRSVVTSTSGGGKWWGHCHYPYPEIHWDPGPINLDRFFGAATPEDDMPSADEIADAILKRTVKDTAGNDRQLGWSIGAILRDGQRQSLQMAALDETIKVLSASKGVDPALIAAEVAKAVKERLAQITVTDRTGV